MSLKAFTSNPTLQQYAQGAAQSAMSKVADFIAPTVEVPTSIGQYKKYDQKHRFHIPNTKRSVGGRATRLGFTASDLTYNCTPHALDTPVDDLEQLEGSALENTFQEAAEMGAEVGALSHEKDVIDQALAAAGAGTDSDFTSGSVDPVDVLDNAIIAVMKAAKMGGLVQPRCLFGPTAWKRFKNNANVRSRIFTGVKNPAKSVTDEQAMALLIGEPQVKTTFMVHDDAEEGLAEDIQFLLDTSILIFVAKENPTRRDSSFMKTFRLRGQWMKPGSYRDESSRSDVASLDWSNDVVVSNSTAIQRVNANNS